MGENRYPDDPWRQAGSISDNESDFGDEAWVEQDTAGVEEALEPPAEEPLAELVAPPSSDWPCENALDPELQSQVALKPRRYYRGVCASQLRWNEDPAVQMFWRACSFQSLLKTHVKLSTGALVELGFSQEVAEREIRSLKASQADTYLRLEEAKTLIRGMAHSHYEFVQTLKEEVTSRFFSAVEDIITCQSDENLLRLNKLTSLRAQWQVKQEKILQAATQDLASQLEKIEKTFLESSYISADTTLIG